MDNQELTTTANEEEFTILVEWQSGQVGVVKASRAGDHLEAMKQESEKAINMAMGTIRAMAYRVSKTMEEMGDAIRPDEAEVEFGINLDAEAGALLARASAGAQITVKLKWLVEQPQRATVLVSE